MIFSDVYNEKGVWQRTPFLSFLYRQDRTGGDTTFYYFI